MACGDTFSKYQNTKKLCWQKTIDGFKEHEILVKYALVELKKPEAASNISPQNHATTLFLVKWAYLVLDPRTNTSKGVWVEKLNLEVVNENSSYNLHRRAKPHLSVKTLHHTAQRCVLPISFYCHSSESAGKEAGKTHLCALHKLRQCTSNFFPKTRYLSPKSTPLTQPLIMSGQNRWCHNTLKAYF